MWNRNCPTNLDSNNAVGRTTSCIQTITLVNSSPFTGNSNPLDSDDILWPADLTGTNAISCVSYLSDPLVTDASNTGEPILIGNVQGCDMVLVSLPTDLNLINNSVGKILRLSLIHISEPTRPY